MAVVELAWPGRGKRRIRFDRGPIAEVRQRPAGIATDASARKIPPCRTVTSEVVGMQDTELYMELAGIAGVFVGFGALIAVRSGGAGEPQEVAPMRLVVGFGMLTVIAALAPVTLGRYSLTEHQIWALSRVLVATVSGVLLFVHGRSPEYRAAKAIVMPTHPAIQTALENAAGLLILGGSAIAVIAIVSGVAPELEAALYFTVVVLLLVLAAWTLLWLVFMQRRPQTASDPAALAATGGSRA